MSLAHDCRELFNHVTQMLKYFEASMVLSQWKSEQEETHAGSAPRCGSGFGGSPPSCSFQRKTKGQQRVGTFHTFSHFSALSHFFQKFSPRTFFKLRHF